MYLILKHSLTFKTLIILFGVRKFSFYNHFALIIIPKNIHCFIFQLCYCSEYFGV